MTRSFRTAVVVGIAVVLATIASAGVYRAILRMPAQTGVDTVPMVVASRQLRLGTRLTADDLKLVSWPAGSRVPDSFARVDEVLNRGLVSSVARNEPLTAGKLAPLEAGAGLPPSIPAGMRAISVKVNEVIGVAGFVVPGTHVDVMVTLSNRQQQQDSLTRVVVSDVQVLTAGTRYDQEKAKEGEPIPSTVVTLLVDPSDAERVALAAAEGQIMLALRNPMDTVETKTSGVRTAGLFGQPPAPAPVPPPARPRARVTPILPVPVVETVTSKVYTVEAIRGAKRTEEIVR